MHELSIASYLVNLVETQLDEAQVDGALCQGASGDMPSRGQESLQQEIRERETQKTGVQAVSVQKKQVRSLHLRIGALSCVHRDALLFSFELAAQGTRLDGATLEIESVPVEIYCAACEQAIQLEGIQSFRCPRCGTPSGDIRAGRELDLVAIELSD